VVFFQSLEGEKLLKRTLDKEAQSDFRQGFHWLFICPYSISINCTVLDTQWVV
jgi:hypothetical protein